LIPQVVLRCHARWSQIPDPRLFDALLFGTRDLLLSNTVRVHRALRAAGVEAELEVYEGQSHAQYLFDDRVPETAVAFGEIAEFFDKHLGK
jgi:monoterpene epsilon-lactone hydrolase